jgi:co-chaperonin GroES (HSP10)
MIQAIHKTIVIKPVLEETKRGGLIIIPETRGARQYQSSYHGIVVSISADSEWRHELKIGDRIIYTRHEGKPVWENGEKCLVMRDRWVLAKLEG